MKLLHPVALALVASLASVPMAEPVSAQSPQIRRVVVYGNDPCPRGSDNEVVVCARRPDNDRYRIPEELRGSDTADDPASQSWAARAESLEYVGQTGTESCSTTGPGGFTGCWEEMMRQWRSDRRSTPENRPRDR